MAFKKKIIRKAQNSLHIFKMMIFDFICIERKSISFRTMTLCLIISNVEIHLYHIAKKLYFHKKNRLIL